jgi:hypothetical protein
MNITIPPRLHRTVRGEMREVKAVREWTEALGWRGALKEVVGEAMARTRLCGCCTPDWLDRRWPFWDDEQAQADAEEQGEDYYPRTVRTVLYEVFCRMHEFGEEIPGSARRLTAEEARELDWWDEEDCGCDYGSPHTCR